MEGKVYGRGERKHPPSRNKFLFTALEGGLNVDCADLISQCVIFRSASSPSCFSSSSRRCHGIDGLTLCSRTRTPACTFY